MPGCQLWDCGTEDQVQASAAEPRGHFLDSQMLLRCKPWRISGDSCGSTPPPACLVAWWGSRGDAREHGDRNQRADLDDRWRYCRVSNIDKLSAEHNAETLTWINDGTQKPWLCLCGVQKTRNHTHTHTLHPFGKNRVRVISPKTILWILIVHDETCSEHGFIQWSVVWGGGLSPQNRRRDVNESFRVHNCEQN